MWYFSLLAQRKVPQKKVHHPDSYRDAAEPARANSTRRPTHALAPLCAALLVDVPPL